MELQVGRLRSGGIMPNYQCNSRCRHCSYLCGPEWSGDYITKDAARRALRAIKTGGCRSVHIGGGEPFLGGDQLLSLIGWCVDEGVAVEYVETNCGWFTRHHTAVAKLRALREAGLGTLLVSMDPFHNEYIPWRKVEGVLAACEEAGMGVFPWTPEMGRDVQQMDRETTHTLEEYEDRFGPGYVQSIPQRYWISSRGRAVETYRRYGPELTADEAAATGGDGCAELFDTAHFHVDLYGNYVPGVCSGLAIDLDDLPAPLDREKYPCLAALMDGGLSALLAMARSEHGYGPERTFSGKCDLCYDIRKFLAMGPAAGSRDLRPAELYEQY